MTIRRNPTCTCLRCRKRVYIKGGTVKVASGYVCCNCYQAWTKGE